MRRDPPPELHCQRPPVACAPQGPAACGLWCCRLAVTGAYSRMRPKLQHHLCGRCAQTAHRKPPDFATTATHKQQQQEQHQSGKRKSDANLKYSDDSIIQLSSLHKVCPRPLSVKRLLFEGVRLEVSNVVHQCLMAWPISPHLSVWSVMPSTAHGQHGFTTTPFPSPLPSPVLAALFPSS